MSSKVDICNLAISHVGSGLSISNFDTDQSEAARTCRLFYEACRKSVLRDFDWQFASRIRALSLIESSPLTDLGEEWSYSYAYPTSCLKFRRILSGSRTDTNSTKIRYKIANTDVGKVIYTDEPDANCEVTEDISETGRFDEDFVLAFSYRLGSLIAPRLAAGDKQRMAANAYQMYTAMIQQARSNSFSEDQSQDITFGDLYDAR